MPGAGQGQGADCPQLGGRVHGRTKRGFHLHVVNAEQINLRLGIVQLMKSAYDLCCGRATFVQLGRALHQPMKCPYKLRNQLRCARLAGDLCRLGHNKVGPVLEKGLEFGGNGSAYRLISESGKPVKRLFNWIRLFQSSTWYLNLESCFEQLLTYSHSRSMSRLLMIKRQVPGLRFGCCHSAVPSAVAESAGVEPASSFRCPRDLRPVRLFRGRGFGMNRRPPPAAGTGGLAPSVAPVAPVQ